MLHNWSERGILWIILVRIWYCIIFVPYSHMRYGTVNELGRNMERLVGDAPYKMFPDRSLYYRIRWAFVVGRVRER